MVIKLEHLSGWVLVYTDSNTDKCQRVQRFSVYIERVNSLIKKLLILLTYDICVR